MKRGQPLAVLEAMKMEHTLSASADALVEAVEVSPGDQVNEGAVIVRFAQGEKRSGMTLHLIKLCVGCDSIEDLAEWQKQRLAELKKKRKPLELDPCHAHDAEARR